MKIKECIDLVDNIKPNQYSTREKVLWLSFIDEIIINDVLRTHEGYDGRYDDFAGYSEDKLSMPLVVPSPYDRLYTAYLKMKIDGENGETARYNNSAAMFNTYLMEYRKYYNKTHMPLNKGHKNKTMPPKSFNAGLTEVEFENLKKELYHLLSDDFAEMTSNDKLYAIVTNYMNTNAAMLKGKDGLNGIDGKDGYTPRKGIDYFDGEKGNKGDKGDKGEQGIQGVQGDKGDKGDNGDPGYTPQKGIDYFTDDDINSLNIPKVNQKFNPQSEDAQSGIAIDKYVTDNFSDIIIETSHSVNSPAEIDCCLKNQEIVGGNITGAEPQIITSKNLCPTPECNYTNSSDFTDSGILSQAICVPNDGGTFNYTGCCNGGVTIRKIELPQGEYCFSTNNSIFMLWVPSIYEETGFLSTNSNFTIAADKETVEVLVWDTEDYDLHMPHTIENCWVQIEKGTSATAFSPYFLGERLYLPQNPVMHFSPTNPIKNCTFTGNGITVDEGTAYHYTFSRAWVNGFNENTMKLEIGQEYIMRFDVTCTDTNNPSQWGFGVFSKKQCSSACNVAAKSQTTIRKADTEQPVYQSDLQNISYTHFSGYFPMNNGQRYIVELVFTSAYSGEVYFGMRSEESSTSLNLNSCLFCKTEYLPMLVDKKINTNLLRIGNIYDSIDLVTGQKIQQIMMDALSFEEEQLEVNNYIKALPSVPAYFVSGTLEDADWVECVTPTSGTNNYTLTQPLSKGYMVYATRTPVTEQIDIDIPVVCTDEFEVYTSSDDNMVPYFQTSVDTKKSANKYLKKISNTIISMGGNI